MPFLVSDAIRLTLVVMFPAMCLILPKLFAD
jgi:hypothetical protein